MNWNNGRPDDWGYVAEEIRHHFIEERSVIVNIDVFEAGASAMLAALLKWLDEPCADHDIEGPFTDELHYLESLIDEQDSAFYKHRKDCPQCMAELKESGK